MECKQVLHSFYVAGGFERETRLFDFTERGWDRVSQLPECPLGVFHLPQLGSRFSIRFFISLFFVAPPHSLTATSKAHQKISFPEPRRLPPFQVPEIFYGSLPGSDLGSTGVLRDLSNQLAKPSGIPPDE